MARRAGASLGGDDDDDFYSGSSGAQEQQRLLVREQDESISMLSQSVQRVQKMAISVNEELSSQNKLLAEIDDEVDRTDTRLKSLQGRLRHLANDSDRGKCVSNSALASLLLLCGSLSAAFAFAAAAAGIA